MRSDNGTTFVGADNVLSEIRETWESSEMSEEISTRGTSWIFIPPGAPHQGGIWEAAAIYFNRSTTSEELSHSKYLRLNR